MFWGVKVLRQLILEFETHQYARTNFFEKIEI
jgi:hypothetical protein